MAANPVTHGIAALVALGLFTLSVPGLHGPGALRASQAAAAPDAAAPMQPGASAAGITLRSVSVELPSSDRMFPGGDAADPVNANCIACHSAGMVLNQPALTRADWEGEVNKMRNVYKAPVAAEDVSAIVAYLAALKPGP